MTKVLSFLLLALFVSCEVPRQAPTGTSNVGALGTKAMIVSAHPLATDIGLKVLKQGGNVIDAAVATQFALAVAYPRAGNIGGGGFAVVRWNNGQVNALDFREKAPLKAHRDMYLDGDGEVIADLSTLGHLAVGVPGSVAGMWELHQKYGRMDWPQLLQPSIDLAKDGHPITADEAEALNEKLKDFEAANTYRPWPLKDTLWQAGDWVVQKNLASTLSSIRDEGRDGFYKGKVAAQIAAEMQSGGGIITLEDLMAYEPVWRDPIQTTYKNYTVYGMSPPSSGGIAVAQLLQGAEQWDLGQYDYNSAKYVHLMAELERRVFADRAEYLGDADFYDVPIKTLTSTAYNRERFQDIDIELATPSSEVSAGQALQEESMETTHFSIVDTYGNAISLTTTLNGNYGSKVLVQGAGFFLNNEMDDFSSKPGVPNMFGLVGAEANSIAPGKRMLSAMSPTIITKQGDLKAVLGTPGGSTIITSVFQTIMNILENDMSMQEAVIAKKVHHQWLPDRILAEEGALAPEVVTALEAKGHRIEWRDKIGRTDCILVRDDGTLEGGADPRGDDHAEGF